MCGDPPEIAPSVFHAARAVALEVVGRLLQRRGASFERRAVSGVTGEALLTHGLAVSTLKSLIYKCSLQT